jgi:hypothetical protein
MLFMNEVTVVKAPSVKKNCLLHDHPQRDRLVTVAVGNYFSFHGSAVVADVRAVCSEATTT